jgi:hypothetical protein
MTSVGIFDKSSISPAAVTIYPFEIIVLAFFLLKQDQVAASGPGRLRYVVGLWGEEGGASAPSFSFCPLLLSGPWGLG